MFNIFKKNINLKNEKLIVPKELNQNIIITIDKLKEDEFYKKIKDLNSSILSEIKEAEKIKKEQGKIEKNMSVDNLFISELKKMKSDISKICKRMYSDYQKTIEYRDNDVWMSIIKNFTPKN